MSIISIKSVEDLVYVVNVDDLIPLVNNAGDTPKSVTPAQITQLLQDYVDAADAALDAKIAGLNTKVIEIGDWNMQSISAITVNHGIADFTKIRSIAALIRIDGDTLAIDFNKTNSSETSTHGIHATSTTINLSRGTLGFFDTPNYNDLSFNRGWITIHYTD